MKKLFLLFAFLGLSIHILGATIADGICGDNVTWTLTDDGVLTVSGSGTMRDAGSTDIDGISVTDNSYGKYYTSIKTVIVNSGVTSIGHGAFYKCSSLSAISIPNTVTSIGGSAFYGCSGLAIINIPNSVTSIGDYAFYGCISLNSIDIPSSVNIIGDYTFYGCDNLTNFTISNSVTSIGRSVFNGTQWYDNQPNGLVYVGLIAYQYKGTMPQNTHIDLKNGCKIIAGSAFYNCSGLVSLTIPNSVTNIGGSAFSGCSGLTSVTIPNSVMNIGSLAFSGCTSLTSVTMGNSVTSIGKSAFYRCSNLTSITIPNFVTSIEWGTFQYCSSLSSVSMGNSVSGIEGSAFSGCSSLTSITIPNSVTSISGHAFSECSSLTSVEIPNSVTSIGNYAFNGCSSLTSVIIGNSVNSIDYAAFYGCKKLVSVTNYSTTPQELSYSTFSNYGTLHVVKGAGEAYSKASCWKNFTIVEDIYVNTDISQMTDVLYSAEMKAKSGKRIVLPIYMKNSEAVTLFQTNVYLPNGFSFAKKANGKYAVSLMKDRLTDEDDNHVISSNVQSDGSLLILCSSQDNYTFDGNDGQVATVTIDVADDVAEGLYLIKLNNQKMVRPNNMGSNVAEYQVVLTVKNYTLGDVNDDGDIDGYDLVGISNLILGTNTDGLIRDAADVNSDGDVDGYDYVMEVNTILGTNASAAKGKNPTLTENALSALTIPTMNVTAGERTQLAVGMECNGDVFTLVQTDIEFPEGVEPMLRNGRVVAKLAGECLGGADDHSISCVKQGSGKYRILIASQNNTGFTGKDGQLFTLSIETSKYMLPGMYDITLSNTKLVRANNTGVNPSDVTAMMVCNEATGINCIEGDNADELLYNLNGQRVSKHAQRGVYISNGKKNVKL